VDTADTDDEALAERWLSSLPPDDRACVEGPATEVAAAAREAIGGPEGYVADAALAFGPWPFGLEDIGCRVTTWHGERDPNAPPRNGAWLAEHLTHATRHVLPGLGHLASLVRSWDAVLDDLAG
jgi:pimeloyl-ACP methyl ester carboxylesterase